ncbi:MAG: hypothetical protein D6714_13485 [Bacteroidetes bacterium]|nr:MAG: hypothetical protein D6714_13485 [Bacteroidota bacterium]
MGNRNIFLSGLCLFFFACQSSEKPQPAGLPAQLSPEVRRILHNAFETAGGLDNWQNLREIHFSKYFALYDETGHIEQEVTQQHDYFPKENRWVIRWEKEGQTHEMTWEKGRFFKKINGQPDTTASPESIKNTLLSATFVVGLPFKLTDPGAKLTYEGPDTLESGENVETIKCVYDPEKFATHSTPDVWWHYFSAEDYRHLGYKVRHADHISYVKNLQFVESGGFLLPSIRKSYRVDSLGNIMFLRADYAYRNYVLR